MKGIRLLILMALLGGILLLGLNLLEFFALTDIYHDYVSPTVITQSGEDVSALPAWSAASGEWMLVTLSRYTSVAYLMFSLFTLLVCWKAIRRLPKVQSGR